MAPWREADHGRSSMQDGNGCCQDALTVFELEALAVRRRFATLLRSAEPRPRGACALLGSDGECRIDPSRPYKCRTHGLPHRWLEEDASETIHGLRDTCHLNSVSPSLEHWSENDM